MRVIGLIFGCYDPLHAGHVRLFRACKEQCDVLHVMIHYDKHIIDNKHRQPWAPHAERMADVSDIKTVDHVHLNYGMSRQHAVDTWDVDIVFLSEEIRGGYTGVSNAKVIYMARTPGIDSTTLR